MIIDAPLKNLVKIRQQLEKVDMEALSASVVSINNGYATSKSYLDVINTYCNVINTITDLQRYRNEK